MDLGTIINIGTAASMGAAGFAAGRRGVARQTIEMLQVQIETLNTSEQKKNDQIIALEGKVEVLEAMVTQRAAVNEVKEIVNRIAERIGA